jgi:NifU-like protein involved in Fe-S cluster formation
MDLEAILERISRLEYHQSLLLKMSQTSSDAFYKLIIEKSLGEDDVKQFYNLCDVLSKELEEQKAEGFVHFHPLFKKFTMMLHCSLQIEEVIAACITQGLYLPLMTELKNYL